MLRGAGEIGLIVDSIQEYILPLVSSGDLVREAAGIIDPWSSSRNRLVGKVDESAMLFLDKVGELER